MDAISYRRVLRDNAVPEVMTLVQEYTVAHGRIPFAAYISERMVGDGLSYALASLFETKQDAIDGCSDFPDLIDELNNLDSPPHTFQLLTFAAGGVMRNTTSLPQWNEASTNAALPMTFRIGKTHLRDLR
jgi:hypothetical protein